MYFVNLIGILNYAAVLLLLSNDVEVILFGILKVTKCIGAWNCNQYKVLCNRSTVPSNCSAIHARERKRKRPGKPKKRRRCPSRVRASLVQLRTCYCAMQFVQS